MRVTTAYNRMFGLPGAWVRDVEFGAQAMIVTVALRRTRPVCSGCGAHELKIKDHRTKRWRHLDMGGVRCYIECRLRRLYCPGCGDRPEMVEWARGGARYTRDFDDLVAWLAQQINQTQLIRLMRIGWETVGNIIARVVAEKLSAGRLDGLELIGVDEVSKFGTHNEHQAMVRLDTEIGNLRSAMQWALEGAPEISLRLAGQLGKYWDVRCDPEGLEWLDAALRAAGEDAPLTDRARARLHRARQLWIRYQGQPVIDELQIALSP